MITRQISDFFVMRGYINNYANMNKRVHIFKR